MSMLPRCIICNSEDIEILYLRINDAVISKIDVIFENALLDPVYTLGSSAPINLVVRNPVIKMNIELLQRDIKFNGKDLQTKFSGLCKKCCKIIGMEQVLALHDL